jgi:hypothetical protein
MPKGKPWSVADERKLRDLRVKGKTVAEIAAIFKLSSDAVKQKLRRLGLKVVTMQNHMGTTTELILPEDLPSVEEALLKLVGAMKALEKQGLSKTEITRLRNIIQAVKIYKGLFADYLNYRDLERRLIELEEKYAEELKRRGITPRIVHKKSLTRVRPGNEVTERIVGEVKTIGEIHES